MSDESDEPRPAASDARHSHLETEVDALDGLGRTPEVELDEAAEAEPLPRDDERTHDRRTRGTRPRSMP